MPKRYSIILYALIIILVSTSMGSANETSKTPHKPTIYVIRQGDTLWDISEIYLNNPYLWPYIWAKNRYIKDPDLIQPGKRLLIPYVDISLLGKENLYVYKLPPEPLHPPVPHKPPAPPSAEKESFHMDIIWKAGYIVTGIIEDSGYITGSEDERNVFGEGDMVNLHLREPGRISPGDRFIVYKPPREIIHPFTKEPIGKLFLPAGIIKILEIHNKEAKGIIISSFRDCFAGDYIRPYTPLRMPLIKGHAPSVSVQGYIVGSMEGTVLNGKGDIVYIDKGLTHKVEPGSIMDVVSEKGTPIGKVKIIWAEDTTSTALIIKSLKPFGRGFQVISIPRS